MAINDLTQSETGVAALQDWIRWPIQPAPVANLDDVIVPVMELEKFQRRFGVVLFPSALFTGAGQTAIMTVTVPNDEIWRMMAVMVRHTIGAVGRQFEFRSTNPVTGNAEFLYSRAEIEAAEFTMLWPVTLRAPPAGDTGDFDTVQEVLLMPRSVIRILSTETSGGAGETQDAHIEFEILPRPFVYNVPRNNSATNIV